MMEAFEALTGILREQAELLNALLALARAENAALVEVDHEALLTSLREQDSLAGALGRLDRDRSGAALALARHLGVPGEAGLSELCDALPPQMAEEGRALHAELRRLAAELESVNRENDVLIRQALHQTQNSIALLTGIARRDERRETYGPIGGRRVRSSVIDRRA